MDAPRRRRLGLALVAAGLAAVFAFQALLPPPEELEYALQDVEMDRGPSVAAVAARGPAVAEYDAGTDTTVLVFQCAHDYCAQAVRVRGDARDIAGRGTAVLDLPGWKRPLRFAELDPPVTVTTAGGESHEVNQVVDATMERQGLAAPVALMALAVGAVAAGIGLQRGVASAGPPVLAVLLGLAAGLFVAVGGPLLLLLVVPAIALVLLAGGALAAAGLRRPRLHRAGVLVVLAGLAVVAAAWAFAPYFTQPPAA